MASNKQAPEEPSGKSGIQLTAVNVLINPARERALVGSRDVLLLKLRADHVALRIHGALERIALPAEHVVAVLAISDTLKVKPLALGSSVVSFVLPMRVDKYTACHTVTSHWNKTYESPKLKTNG